MDSDVLKESKDSLDDTVEVQLVPPPYSPPKQSPSLQLPPYSPPKQSPSLQLPPYSPSKQSPSLQQPLPYKGSQMSFSGSSVNQPVRAFPLNTMNLLAIQQPINFANKQKNLKEKLLDKDLYNECVRPGIHSLNIMSLQKQSQITNLPIYKLLHACSLYDLRLTPTSVEFFYDKTKELDRRQDAANRFTMVKVLGKGAYGTVQEAVDNVTNEHVAIKTYAANSPDFNEVDCCMRFRHPNLMYAKGFFYNEQNELNLVLPLAESTLEQLYKDLKKSSQILSEKQAVDMMVGAISAMAFLQSQGFFHCDLKADNTFIFRRKDGTLRLVIGDMSLSYPYVQQEFRHCGTVYYAAPERKTKMMEKEKAVALQPYLQQYKHVFYQQQDALSSDMFLLGNLFFYILTGHYWHGNFGQSTLDYYQSVLENVHDPQAYMNKQVARFPHLQGWEGLLLALLDPDAPNRPKDYVSLLTYGKFAMAHKITTLVTGYVQYNNIVGDITNFTPQEKVLLRSAVAKIYKYYAVLYKVSNHIRHYECLFTAVELLYRFWTKRRQGLHQKVDCTIKAVCMACIRVAARLCLGDTKLYWPDCQPTKELEKAIDGHDILKTEEAIVTYLNGQLRYPYIMELVTSIPEMKEILVMAAKEPNKFVELLVDPATFFNKHAYTDFHFGNTLTTRGPLHRLHTIDFEYLLNNTADELNFQFKQEISPGISLLYEVYDTLIMNIATNIKQSEALDLICVSIFEDILRAQTAEEAAIQLLNNVRTSIEMSPKAIHKFRKIKDLFVDVNGAKSVRQGLSTEEHIKVTEAFTNANEAFIQETKLEDGYVLNLLFIMIAKALLSLPVHEDEKEAYYERIKRLIANIQ